MTGNEPGKFEAFICLLVVGAVNSNSQTKSQPIDTRILYMVNKRHYLPYDDCQIMKNLLIESIHIMKNEIEGISNMAKFKELNMKHSMVYKYDMTMISKLGLRDVHHFAVFLNKQSIYKGSARYTTIMRNITINDLSKFFTDEYVNDKRMKEYREVLVCFFFFR